MNQDTPPFRFKRFTVRQARAAMKVGVDGVLLGAWTDVTDCRRILDVGTGTGLIALMLAQRTERVAEHNPAVRINAVEIDAMAAQDALFNVADSPWKHRIEFLQCRVQDLPDTCSYDLVVCNPPYFDNGLASPNRARSLARHDGELSFEMLCRLASRSLAPSGRLSVILPADRYESSVSLARDHALYCRRVLRVKPLPGRPVKRVLVELRRREGPVEVAELTIELRRHIYSVDFRALARDFYLSF